MRRWGKIIRTQPRAIRLSSRIGRDPLTHWTNLGGPGKTNEGREGREGITNKIDIYQNSSNHRGLFSSIGRTRLRYLPGGWWRENGLPRTQCGRLSRGWMTKQSRCFQMKPSKCVRKGGAIINGMEYEKEVWINKGKRENWWTRRTSQRIGRPWQVGTRLFRAYSPQPVLESNS